VEGVAGGYATQIQIDNNDTFSSPVQTKKPAHRCTDLHRPPDAGRRQVLLARARHHSAGVAGAWSAARSFTFTAGRRDRGCSPPVNPTTTGDHHARVHLERRHQCDDLPDSTQQRVHLCHAPAHQAATSTRPATPVTPALPDGKYYWRVRGVTAAGVAGKWSAAWVITIRYDPARPCPC